MACEKLFKQYDLGNTMLGHPWDVTSSAQPCFQQKCFYAGMYSCIRTSVTQNKFAQMGFRNRSESRLEEGFRETQIITDIALNTQSHKQGGSQCDFLVHHDFGFFFR